MQIDGDVVDAGTARDFVEQHLGPLAGRSLRVLAVEFPGSDELAAGVLARTFPWIETQPNDGSWRTLLWALGRIALADRPRLEEDGLPGLREPLADWDGTPPRARRQDVVEWVLEREGVWRAVYAT